MTLILTPVTPSGVVLYCSDSLPCSDFLPCAEVSITLTPVVAI